MARGISPTSAYSTARSHLVREGGGEKGQIKPTVVTGRCNAISDKVRIQSIKIAQRTDPGEHPSGDRERHDGLSLLY